MLALVSVATLAVVGVDRTDALAAPSDQPTTAISTPVASATSGDPSARGLATAPVTVPGNLTGLGFDACRTPSQAAMDEMRQTTQYWGVGVYIGGESRTCNQPNLTRSWVRTQHAKGWHVFPIWAGLQAPKVDGKRCSDRSFPNRMSGSNRKAQAQGIQAANRAVTHAKGLGMAKGSTLFLDMESWDNTRSGCNQPVLHFQSGWSKRLHALGWKSGFYSSLKTGIKILDFVRTTSPGFYTMPDAIWFSFANGKPTLDGSPSVKDSHWPKQRLHQYRLDLDRSYAGEEITLDQNVIAIGRGSVPGPAQGTCGVDMDFGRYLPFGRGDRSPQVAAAQCQLRRHGLYAGELQGRFDRTTARAVGRWQTRVQLPETRALNGRTWTSLLAAGDAPLVKRGSAGDRVRYLQRALTAALGGTTAISGVFSAGTTSAVERYQRAVGLPRTGVVDRTTWRALQAGDR